MKLLHKCLKSDSTQPVKFHFIKDSVLEEKNMQGFVVQEISTYHMISKGDYDEDGGEGKQEYRTKSVCVLCTTGTSIWHIQGRGKASKISEQSKHATLVGLYLVQ